MNKRLNTQLTETVNQLFSLYVLMNLEETNVKMISNWWIQTETTKFGRIALKQAATLSVASYGLRRLASA